MKFGLVVNLNREGARYAVEQLVEWADHAGHDLIAGRDVAEVTVRGLTACAIEDLADQSDLIVSIGGDGTLLAASRIAVPPGKPVLGINAGSLGFLTQLQPTELIESMNRIVSGRYEIEERMLLQAVVLGTSNEPTRVALNEVVIDNGPVSRLIRILLRVNGEEIVTYRADGLVIATPTGSTAYSLAVGGPIIHPQLEGIIIAPISSFSLATRPMVLAPTDRVELQIDSDHEVAGLTVDGQIRAVLNDTARVHISRAPQKAKFVTFQRQSFYRLVKNKLHWGLSPRGG